MINWKRALRTPHSERFLAFRDGKEVAAVELHYLPNGSANGTVIILRSSGMTEADVQGLLSSLDEDFLPDVDLAQGTLAYTVVIGEVLGSYEATSNRATT